MTSGPLRGASVDRGPRRPRTLPLIALFTLAITGFVMFAALAGAGFPSLGQGPVYTLDETAGLDRACLGDRVDALAAPGIEAAAAPGFSINETPPSFYECVFAWTADGEILANVLTVRVAVWGDTVPEYTGAIAAAEDAEDQEVVSTAVPGFANSFCTRGGAAEGREADYTCRLSDANLEVTVHHGVWAGEAAAFGPEAVDMIALAAAIGEAAKAAFLAPDR